jgi:nitrile hydratase accessory protein
VTQDAFTPERVFSEPWEARVFAMAVMLHQRGVFSWSEWTLALSREIHLAKAAGDTDLGNTYYQHWLNALEALTTRAGLKAWPPP